MLQTARILAKRIWYRRTNAQHLQCNPLALICLHDKTRHGLLIANQQVQTPSVGVMSIRRRAK